MKITRETDRLILRQWKASDYDVVYPHYQNADFTQHLGGNKDKEATWSMIVSYAGQWELNGFSYWALEEKSTGEFVGACGLWKSPEWPEIELGYWIIPPFQGKGYASEAAKYAKQFAFNELNLPTLVSYIDAKNQASVKVAKKLEGEYDQTIELMTYGPHDVYRYKK